MVAACDFTGSHDPPRSTDHTKESTSSSARADLIFHQMTGSQCQHPSLLHSSQPSMLCTDSEISSLSYTSRSFKNLPLLLSKSLRTIGYGPGAAHLLPNFLLIGCPHKPPCEMLS